MRNLNLPIEAVAALDEAMPPLDGDRQDYGPEGCFRDGVAFFGLAAVLLVVIGRKAATR